KSLDIPQRKTDQINNFEATVFDPTPTDSGPLAQPGITQADLDFIDDPDHAGQTIPAIALTGPRFTVIDPNHAGAKGSQLGDLKVFCETGGKVSEGDVLKRPLEPQADGSQKIWVRPPKSVTVGQAVIRVERPVDEITDIPDEGVAQPPT